MHIVFDFDGTISNSIKGIQQSFDESFYKNFGVKNTVDLFPLVGPPIHLILQKIRPATTEAESAQFVADFRKKYDTEGHLLNTLYPKILDVILQLSQWNHTLYIATFKRRQPLMKIMEDHNMVSYFKSINTYDKPDGSVYPSKSMMLQDLIREHQLADQTICMVGDSHDDWKAASENKIPFVFASYGYGSELPAIFTISEPIELLSIIQNIHS